jgi:alpha-glucosidase (family GH31 glycosyl hydrolase)
MRSRHFRPLSLVLAALLLLAPASAGSASGTAAHPGSTVVEGKARFQILSPTMIRLEYAGDGVFQNATTFNAVNRGSGRTAYTTTVSRDGYRVIRTGALTLRYRQNSGPFTDANLSVLVAGTKTTAAPIFPSYCRYDTTACEAENALIEGNAATAYDHSGQTGTGFIDGLQRTGSSITHDVSAVPSAGTYRLAVRYANSTGGDGANTTRTLSAVVNGVKGPTISFPPTGSWDTWSTAAVDVNLRAGTNSVQIRQDSSDSGNVNLDSLAVIPTSATTYPSAYTGLSTTAYGAGPKSTLGGWARSLDNPAGLPVAEHPGILTKDGWYLLDDTRSALLSSRHTVTDRRSHGAQPYQDGYFFGYGQDYKQGLSDLNTLTGSIALLPQSAYGVWYSRYFAYSQADYKNTLLPKFRSTKTPIDWLVVDTDWKSPSQWNGWNWNPELFPDPQAFLSWTKSQGLSVSMNIHPSIAPNDAQFATADAQAGGLTAQDANTYRFDWSVPAQLRAYLNLHQGFEKQGVRAWWLDYCTSCGASTVSDPQVAPDNLINQAYADNSTSKGLRGFTFSRIGGSEQGSLHSSYPLGPWSERRNTLHFTGDTPGSWEMLAYESKFTAGEAAVGLSNVSHDIGSFHGGHLADDLYARWVQLGTFQPIDRLHSDHGDRLPWDYPGAAGDSAQQFLKLREALVPYTYTLARQANVTGVPIVRPMYLEYPKQAEAYTSTGQYLYGDKVLVAPITTPNDAEGNGSVSVWVPPGSWTDYFTGRTYTGPATTTITAPLSRMPVLIKSGGIMPTRTDYVDNAAQRPLKQLTVNVAAGADGAFSWYQDAGEGHGYQRGESTTTPISWQDKHRTLTVGRSTGSYPGAVAARAYTLSLSNASAPRAVTVDGVRLPRTAWGYDPQLHKITVTTASLSVRRAHTIALTGTA